MKSYRTLFFIFLIALLTPFIYSSLVLPMVRQFTASMIVEKVGFSEIKDKKPTFIKKIVTEDSITEIVSYLPSNILSEKNFNEKAAQDTIVYVEKIAQGENVYTFNPFARDGFDVDVKMVPRMKPYAENTVIFFSSSDPIPGVLEKKKGKYQLLTELIDQNKSFYWTEQIGKGAVSFLRHAEPKTFAHALPTTNNEELTVIQQLNMGFNVEIWKRSVRFQPEPPGIHFEDHERTLFGTSESLWNTFGRLLIVKQEGIPIQLLIDRLNNRVLSMKLNRSYYPFDEKAKAIYEGAPTEPIIK
jgi:hypothetical protein